MIRNRSTRAAGTAGTMYPTGDRSGRGGAFQAEVLGADPQGLRAAVGRRSYLAQANQLDIVPAELSRSALVGAAELAFQSLLDDPRHAVGPPR
ncbi:MAG: hypothetical protein ABJA16_13875 [Nakamurella sp.]